MIVGAGVVGLATAYQLLLRNPKQSVVVLDKEGDIAKHQSSHNSGVIHAGIYYKPGSLKATNCRRGKAMLEEFCQVHDIHFKRCGKVIVATSEDELPSLERIYERGIGNGVQCEKISKARLAELEPHVSGVAAIHVSETGVIDFFDVATKLAELIRSMGGRIELNQKVSKIHAREDEIVVETEDSEFPTKLLVNCAGLYSDRILSMCGTKPQAQIIPFRGEYYLLKPEAAHLCNNLIYPVPNPKFPFLGVHVTRTIHGEVDCGPNAVLAFAREGYKRSQLNLAESLQTATFPGFYKLLAKNLSYAATEFTHSLFKQKFVDAVNRLVPEIQASDLMPAPAGVRAQAVSADGNPVDDFLIQRTHRAIHVLNAPSPAATSCLSIGSTLVDMVELGCDLAA